MDKLLDLLPDRGPLMALLVNAGLVVTTQAVASLLPLTTSERWAMVVVFLGFVVMSAYPSWTRRAEP